MSRTGLQESLKCPLPLVGSFLIYKVYGTTAEPRYLKLHNKTHPPFF